MNPETSPLLAQLLNAETVADQVASLRLLKHELIGYDQRKEAWVHWGIIPLLSKILSTKAGGSKKAAVSGNQNGLTNRQTDIVNNRTEDEEACLQAAIIVGSLAQGGPAFVSPILSSSIVPSLLSILAADCPESLALPILQSFNTIADRYILQNVNWPQDNHLGDILFAPDYVNCYARIIAGSSPSSVTQSCSSLAATLIAKVCTDEIHKNALVEHGALDALAMKLASFVVAQGFVLPGAECHLGQDGALSSLPPPAPSTAKIAPILRAAAVLIENSKSRAEHFLSSPGILTVFPGRLPEFSPTDIKRNPWGMPYLSGTAVPRQFQSNPFDVILPSVPQNQSSALSNFPPLVPIGSFHKRSLSFLESSPSDEEENAVVPWLLHLVRTESGMARVMAARFVTALFRLELVKKHRIPMFSYIVIPILLQMLVKDYDFTAAADPQYDGLIPTTLRLREEVPFILAALIMDTNELQKHASEGNAIKTLSRLLKETYNTHQVNAKVTWSADTKTNNLHSEISSEVQLGPVGFSPMTCHILRYREGILRAIASLALFSDEYRKSFCENGIVPYVINALKPRPPTTTQDATETKNGSTDGNPIPTILAACGATRALTRSVSVLRTSMIDAGVATPLLELFVHPDIEVQIAATSVLCNLALDFSPMRESLVNPETLSTLCDHAHSTNMKLRLESLWVLKHIVYNAPNDLRIKIINSLDPSWLGELMSMDPVRKEDFSQDMDNGSLLGMGSSNSAGEKVDLLNPMEDVETGDEAVNSTAQNESGNSGSILPDASRLKKLALSGELHRKKQARLDDFAVQEQALNLVRNSMIGTESSEIVDLLLKEIGHHDFLDILAEKVRPRPIPTRRDSPSRSTTSRMPSEILVAVTYVIVNIAAGPPRYRDLLFSHHDLLKDLVWLYEHPVSQVRINCVWVAINLTFADNHSDQPGCRERALKLKALGYVDRLRALEKDAVLDVRERTKTALEQFRTLIDL